MRQASGPSRRLGPWRAGLVGAVLLALAMVATTDGVGPADAAVRTSSWAPRYQFGIDTYLPYSCQPAAEIEAWATTEVTQYKALGANAIGIAFPIYDNSVTSNVVYAKADCDARLEYASPPPAILADVIHVARAHGLQVLLRPSFDQSAFFPYTSNQLAPADPQKWFESYLATLEPYLKLAQAYRVQHFSIESELDEIAPNNIWNSAILQARSWYHGDLEWNLSWNDLFPKQLRPGTSFSIDAYPPLRYLWSGSSWWQIETKWVEALQQPNTMLPQVAGTVIDEIGISAQDGAYRYPAYVLPMANHAFDQKIQVRWFTAACKFMKRKGMRGMYFWGPWLVNRDGALLTQPDPTHPMDLQPAGQATIKSCFTNRL
jgi:hypothetical protein